MNRKREAQNVYNMPWWQAVAGFGIYLVLQSSMNIGSSITNTFLKITRIGNVLNKILGRKNT